MLGYVVLESGNISRRIRIVYRTSIGKMTDSRSTSNATIADCGLELVRELYNNPDIIPPYNEDLIKRCTQRMTELYHSNFSILMKMRENTSSTPNEKAMIMVKAQQVAIERIKQCCFSYINERLDRLKHLRWRFGGILPPNVKANLSNDELSWWKKYNQLVFGYQSKIGENGMNLFNHVHPPKSLLVHVRAVKDYGEFETSDGTTVLFSKNSMHYLPRQDCENLIRTGILEYAN